jgi:hypothetical protein
MMQPCSISCAFTLKIHVSSIALVWIPSWLYTPAFPLDDPAIGLENGELIFPGHVLRQEVFDPVVNQVGNLLILLRAVD